MRSVRAWGLGLVLALAMSASPLALAGDQPAAAAPPCPDSADGLASLPVNNDQVVQWKASTPNQTLKRAHVAGTITNIYPDHSGHSHFEIRIGSVSNAYIEVIYNQDFGTVPSPQMGQSVEACGDYITSTAQSGPYPASPDGAIIHWVHQSPNPGKHDSGFMMIDGVVYGQLAPNSGPPPRRGH